MIRPGMMCFDIGAHLGDRSVTFMKLGAEVVAVEPQPKFFNYLNKKLGSIAQVHLESTAVGKHVGEAELSISTRHPTLSTLANREWQSKMDEVASATIDFDQKITVPTTTLDALSEKYGRADFVKIDVEGFELEVMKGLSYQPSWISIEFLSFDLIRLQDCLDHMDSMGYTSFNWSYKETFVWQNDQWTSSNDIFNQIATFGNNVFSGDVYAQKI